MSRHNFFHPPACLKPMLASERSIRHRTHLWGIYIPCGQRLTWTSNAQHPDELKSELRKGQRPSWSMSIRLGSICWKNGGKYWSWSTTYRDWHENPTKERHVRKNKRQLGVVLHCTDEELFYSPWTDTCRVEEANFGKVGKSMIKSYNKWSPDFVLHGITWTNKAGTGNQDLKKILAKI